MIFSLNIEAYTLLFFILFFVAIEHFFFSTLGGFMIELRICLKKVFVK